MEQFTRTSLLIGEDNLNKLINSKIIVFGVGGVGSYVVESLVRSGIGNISIVDFDVVDITNINRQIIALHSTIGKKKVEVIDGDLSSIISQSLISLPSLSSPIEEYNEVTSLCFLLFLICINISFSMHLDA